jgi:Arc/MetJ-type ribon-helix-helix transcriptional regulator
LDDILEKAVSEGGLYRSKSDLVRDAVRSKLKEMGFMKNGVRVK